MPAPKSVSSSGSKASSGNAVKRATAGKNGNGSKSADKKMGRRIPLLSAVVPIAALGAYLVRTPASTLLDFRSRTPTAAQLLKRSGLSSLPFSPASTPSPLTPNVILRSAASPPEGYVDARSPPFLREGPYTPLPAGMGGVRGEVRADEARQAEIREAFEGSWASYVQHGWGADEYHPISHSGSNLTAAGGIGYTIVDSLDSLLVMGLEDEYERARDWVRDELDFDRDGEFNTFETTIRILGGLLSAHYLSSQHPTYSPTDPEMYLAHAVDLADRLLATFDSPSGIPWSLVNLGKREGVPDRDNNRLASLAEAGTMGLEFKYLSHLTGDATYWQKVEQVAQIFNKETSIEGIASIFISPDSGKFMISEIRLGSRGDSYYEYLIKQYLQTNRKEGVYRDIYDRSMRGIKNHLMARSPREKLVYTQELAPRRQANGQPGWQVVPKQDHLVCFLGGSFLLGLTEGGHKAIDWSALSRQDWEDYQAGTGIIGSCMATHQTATGLAPEIAMFLHPEQKDLQQGDWYIKSGGPGSNVIDGRNILRPETVESLFLAYRLTGDQRYRDYGWAIFKAFKKHCRLPDGGYASIQNVDYATPAKQEDKMETFWLSETLKYLYLLFGSSDEISLKDHVFNTEAHILPVFDPEPAELSAWSRGPA